MTEADWLACDDPDPMLAFLRTRATPRKLRLFAVACIWERGALVGEEANRRFLAAFVRFADGEGTLRKTRVARRATFPTWRYVSILDCPNPDDDAWETATSASGPAGLGDVLDPARAARRNAAQSHLARCVFGNPFRPAVARPPWGTPDVAAIARAAYEEGFLESGFLDRVRLSILADALEDAGCDDTDILGHLRGPGPHVRGCWVVDLLLGKS